jgi:tetratricopeptide (TPR) repeat protein
MLDVQLFGLDPSGHHFVSLFFHTANTVLLFLVLMGMTGASGRSAFVAAAFAFHPLHAESVAWVSERKDVLSGFFFLLTLAAYAGYAGKIRVARLKSRIFYWLAVVLFGLGLMSKPMLVTLPFVLLLVDYWPLRRLVLQGKAPFEGSSASALGLRSAIIEKLPLFVLSAASCVVTLVVQEKWGAVVSLENLPLDARIANAIVSYVRYLGKAIWPSNLVIPYPSVAWPAWIVFAAASVLVFITWSTFLCRRNRPYWITGWLWFLGMLLPTIGLVQVGLQSMADRYTYLPLIGLLISLSWGLHEVGSRVRLWRAVSPGAAILILFALAVATRFQVVHWASSRTLFEHALDRNPANYLAEYYMADALAREGRFTEANEHYEKSVRINPKYTDAYNDWGVTLATMGRVDEAIEKYESALAINPAYVRANNNLALAYAAMLRTDRTEMLSGLGSASPPSSSKTR